MIDWFTHHLAVIGIWLSAFFTLSIYSMLYKENPVYRLAEHIFIGASSGYAVYAAWSQVLKPLWWDEITKGHWYWIFALVAGGMFYFIFSQKHAWISRIIFGGLMGLIAGMAFKGFVGMNSDQIYSSFKPLYVRGDIAASASNILFVLILLTVMAYFFFSFEHKNAVQRVPARIGRWTLMFAFGAMFGATVMARMSLLIGRIFFLLSDWLHIIKA